MAAILYLIHNAIFKVLFDYINMSGVNKTRMLDTNIMNLHLFCLKKKKLFHLVQMAAVTFWSLK